MSDIQLGSEMNMGTLCPTFGSPTFDFAPLYAMALNISPLFQLNTHPFTETITVLFQLFFFFFFQSAERPTSVRRAVSR